MDQASLKNVAHKCASRILKAKSNNEYFSKPFQYAVVDNFLPSEMANFAMENFPPLSCSSWDAYKRQIINV